MYVYSFLYVYPCCHCDGLHREDVVQYTVRLCYPISDETIYECCTWTPKTPNSLNTSHFNQIRLNDLIAGSMMPTLPSLLL